MRAEENKAVVHRFVDEVQNRGRLDLLTTYLADDFTHHSEEAFDRAPGIEGARQIHRILRTALPDHDAVVHHMCAEDDLVMTHKTFTGTHRGEFLGIQPTGRRVTIRVMDVICLREGKFADHWSAIDLLVVLKQMGAMPELG